MKCAYRAFDPETGQSYQGVLDADTLSMAQTQLLQKKWQIIHLAPATTSWLARCWANVTLRSARSSQSNQSKQGISLFRPTSTLQHWALWCGQLSHLLRAGIPFFEALQHTQTTLTPASQQQIQTALQGLEQGQAVMVAFQSVTLPPLMLMQLELAMLHGDLAGTLAVLSDDLWARIVQGQQWQKILLYPLVLLAVFVGLLGFLLFYLVPQLLQFAQTLHQPLPLLSRCLAAVHHGLVTYPKASAITASVLMMALGIWLYHPAWRVFRQRLLRRIPLFGELWLSMQWQRFNASLAQLQRAGIPLLKALHTLSEQTASHHVQSAIRDSVALIERGQTLSQAFGQGTPVLWQRPLWLKMVEIGEKTGALEAQLTAWNQGEGLWMQQQFHAIQTLAEPLLTLLLGGLIGILIIGTLSPVYDLLTQFHR
jgi:type II secretory pathway component PulF